MFICFCRCGYDDVGYVTDGQYASPDYPTSPAGDASGPGYLTESLGYQQVPVPDGVGSAGGGQGGVAQGVAKCPTECVGTNSGCWDGSQAEPRPCCNEADQCVKKGEGYGECRPVSKGTPWGFDGAVLSCSAGDAGPSAWNVPAPDSGLSAFVFTALYGLQGEDRNAG